MSFSALLCFYVTLSTISAAEQVSIDDFLLTKAPATAPSVRVSYTLGSEADFDSAVGGFSYKGTELDIPLRAPHYLNDYHALTFGAIYKATWLDTDTFLNNMDLHEFRLKLRWMYRQPGSQWSWMGLLQPGLATDGSSIDMDDFILDGQLGFRYAKTSRFAWIGGVVVFYNSMETRVYPGIGFQWQPSDKVTVSLTGPNFKASWQPHDDWILYAGAKAAGGTWNVRDNGQDFDVRVRSYQAGIGVERRLADKIWLGLWGGVTFANDLEIETASGRELFDDDADIGWFMKLGIRRAIW